MSTKREQHEIVDKILDARALHYGQFTNVAECADGLNRHIARCLHANAKQLAPDQAESLRMICNKIGRIVSGDPDYIDSWDDIAGYAKLVADRLRGEER